jgi:hypothetical protein
MPMLFELPSEVGRMRILSLTIRTAPETLEQNGIAAFSMA